MSEQLLLHSPAFFWDGTTQLPGELELYSSRLHFQFSDFKHSHLHLTIPLSNIINARVFMIFNIAKNGLRVDSHDGKVDLFVLEDCRVFCNALLLNMEKVVKK